MLFKIVALFFLISSTLFAKGFEAPWGKDSDLNKAPSYRRVKESSVAAKIAESVIRFHQNVISPANGSRSNFRPSSSRYMQLAIQRYGFLKGYIMGCDRLLRENSEKWIYGDVIINGYTYKFDPAWEKKHRRFSPESTLALLSRLSKSKAEDSSHQ